MSLRLSVRMHESLSTSKRPGWRLAEEMVLVASIKEQRGVWVLPQGECLISVNGTQESM